MLPSLWQGQRVRQRFRLSLTDVSKTTVNRYLSTLRKALRYASRKQKLTADMAAVLFNLLAQSKCEYVFTSLHDRAPPVSANTLANQHRSIMHTCRFHPDAGLHALRHTFLTEAGRHTQNVKALQRLAGHSRIETTMRYIHPDAEDVLEIASAVQWARANKIAGGVTTVFTTANEPETQRRHASDRV